MFMRPRYARLGTKEKPAERSASRSSLQRYADAVGSASRLRGFDVDYAAERRFRTIRASSRSTT